MDNYLGRVTKARILQAVAEAKGQRAAERIGHLKKGEMAAQAEILLADTGWLPEPLRTAGLEKGDDGKAVYLIHDAAEGEASGTEGDPAHRVAAE